MASYTCPPKTSETARIRIPFITSPVVVLENIMPRGNSLHVRHHFPSLSSKRPPVRPLITSGARLLSMHIQTLASAPHRGMVICSSVRPPCCSMALQISSGKTSSRRAHSGDERVSCSVCQSWATDGHVLEGAGRSFRGMPVGKLKGEAVAAAMTGAALTE
jgi:hypothetical protein